ncbi:histidine kinase [Allomuricauda sp. M10]|uniref:histidine kinase n=1 Tax=Allomuricauda sp. M10 TaxID=2683292 RepID=UPI001D17F462|nr:histidine kinase [Muricauda sp. M10]
MFQGVSDFFAESNQNGFGFFVVSVLFYLFVFFLIQFFQHKKRFYLFYALYALVTGMTLMKYVEGVFFTDFFNEASGRLFTRWFHYPAQWMASILFTFFIAEIMDFKKDYPKFVKFVKWGYWGIAPLYFSLWGVFLFNPRSYLIDYCEVFLLLPMNLIAFVWGFILVIKQNRIIKWYILLGMTSLFISYIIISLYSIKAKTANSETLYIFYVGVLLESLMFALAIGLEQKMVYVQKAHVQRKYIGQLEENQSIKESINKALSDELVQTKAEIVGLSTEAQKERSEKLAIKVENKISQLRLEALRSQMNPHFIFNALNSIKSYFIENNQEKAIYYLGRFSKLIRGILESSRKDLITLDEELNIIKMYVEIESDRFKNGMEYTLAMDKDIPAHIILVPSLLLQPFVENSIWHGLSTRAGKKKLTIKVEGKDPSDPLKIIISDNGIGRQASRAKNIQNPLKGQSLGLSIIKDRLDFFSKKYQGDFNFAIHDLVDEKSGKPLGTEVVIHMPKLMPEPDPPEKNF